MKVNYIEFFSVEIPNWMRASNQKMAEVGFNTQDYWYWCVESMGQLCEKYQDDPLVVNQMGLIFDWLEAQAKGVSV